MGQSLRATLPTSSERNMLSDRDGDIPQIYFFLKESWRSWLPNHLQPFLLHTIWLGSCIHQLWAVWTIVSRGHDQSCCIQITFQEDNLTSCLPPVLYLAYCILSNQR